ncbi:unnamed protein product [Urochloa decumbens]|uniref:Peroxidase n=1 Tax=Urochloa decumbens TaxID=240449 RepID=A0ABC9F7Z8_9POAL
MASVSCLSLLVLVALASAASAQLSSTFYDTSCPRALATIKSAVNAAVAQEARMGASLLRLHFHDCFVQGCDASILLAGNEQNDGPNLTLRGFNVIANIKAQVEAVCKQTVSCADILAVAARDSVVALGGPSWTVPLGRRDSPKAASTTMVTQNLLPPTSSLTALIKGYGNLGLSPTDMVALSGALPELPGPHLQRHKHQQGVRDVAQGELPGDGRRQRDGAAGHDDAHQVRQRLLQQPAVAEGAPPLRPGALQRRQHRQHRQELRVQPVGLQQRLRHGHGEHGQHQPSDGDAGADQDHMLRGQLVIQHTTATQTNKASSKPTIIKLDSSCLYKLK